MPEKKHRLIVWAHAFHQGGEGRTARREAAAQTVAAARKQREGLARAHLPPPYFPIQAGAPVIQSSHSHPEWAPCPHVSLSANTPTDRPGDVCARSLQIQTG